MKAKLVVVHMQVQYFNLILYTFVFPCVRCSIVYLHIYASSSVYFDRDNRHIGLVSMYISCILWPTSVKRLLYCLSKAAGRHVCIGLVYMYVSTTTMIHVYVGVLTFLNTLRRKYSMIHMQACMYDLRACGKRTLPPSAADRILGQLTLPIILEDT